jgi:hypothetical protein
MKKFEVFSGFPHLFWNLGDLLIAVRDYRIDFREFSGAGSVVRGERITLHS